MSNPTIQSGIATLHLTADDAALLAHGLTVASENSAGDTSEKLRLWAMVMRATAQAAAAQLHLPPAAEEGLVVYLGSVFQEAQCTR